MKVTITEAARITGRNGNTLRRWIDNGWIPVEEFADGRGTRVLLDVNDVPAAEETARRTPKHRFAVWFAVDAEQQRVVDRIIPGPDTAPHKQLRTWVRRNRGLFDA